MSNTYTFCEGAAETTAHFQSSAIDKLEFFMSGPVDCADHLAVTRHLKIHGEWPVGDIRVHFTNGRVYTYEDVPFDLFLAVAEADSPGVAFQINLRHLPAQRES